jgi:hypothetical protein
MSVPNTFSTATGTIPLAQLDANFAYYDNAFNIAAGTMTVGYNLTTNGVVSGTGFTNYLASPPNIGSTTPATGSFTTLSATSNALSSVNAKSQNLTSVTAVAGSLTLATGGITLASQSMDANEVWRVTAYGNYVSVSSANARSLSLGCFWGSTALTPVSAGTVTPSNARTTPWRVEFSICGISTTSAWVTSFASSQVASGTIALNYAGTPTLVTGLTTTATLDFRVGQTGTATAGDTINVYSVVIERIA